MGLELRQAVVDRQKQTIQALNAWKRKQFDYGDADCCQFVAHVIKHISGKDYSKAFAYNDQEEADQLISKFGSLTPNVIKYAPKIAKLAHMKNSRGSLSFNTTAASRSANTGCSFCIKITIDRFTKLK